MKYTIEDINVLFKVPGGTDNIDKFVGNFEGGKLDIFSMEKVIVCNCVIERSTGQFYDYLLLNTETGQMTLIKEAKTDVYGTKSGEMRSEKLQKVISFK